MAKKRGENIVQYDTEENAIWGRETGITKINKGRKKKKKINRSSGCAGRIREGKREAAGK